MEACTNFHGSISIYSNFHVNCHKVNLLALTSTEASMAEMFISIKVNLFHGRIMEVGGNLYGSKSNGSRWTLMAV